VFLDSSARAALVGVAVAAVAALGLAWWLCPRSSNAHGPRHRMRAELWHNGGALLAFFAFTNLDVPLARHLFTPHQAGLYAGGAIIAKACLFLPTFVIVAAFPSMATDRRGTAWVRPFGVVVGLGAGAVLGTALLPGLAESFAGGAKYAGLGPVAWVFALEGTLFAVLQMLVYGRIAAQSAVAAPLWLGAGALTVTALLFAQPIAGLAALSAAIAAVTGTVLLVATLRRQPARSVRLLPEADRPKPAG
jgi:O-antigen/teichoic acid export membrane protein